MLVMEKMVYNSFLFPLCLFIMVSCHPRLWSASFKEKAMFGIYGILVVLIFLTGFYVVRFIIKLLG